MAELILIDRDTKQEVGRKPMDASGRYWFYTDCANHERVLFDGKYYTMHSVAWKIPEQELIATVTYHSQAVQACED